MIFLLYYVQCYNLVANKDSDKVMNLLQAKNDVRNSNKNQQSHYLSYKAAGTNKCKHQLVC